MPLPLQHSAACLKLLEVYIQLGEKAIGCRENQLRRIAFTLLMEVHSLITLSPMRQALHANPLAAWPDALKMPQFVKVLAASAAASLA